MKRHRFFEFSAATGALLLVAGCNSASAEPSLDEVRQIAERYQNVRQAIADGYTTDHKCVTAEMLGFPARLGAMGLHYVRRGMLGLPPKPASGPGRVHGTGTHTDFRKPSMLVYEPQPDGSLKLIAVENLVFAAAWHGTAGHQDAPMFHGRAWPLLKDDAATTVDEAHGWEPHYEQHLWVFRKNPNGAYAPFNPSVTCRYNPSPAAHAARPASTGQKPTG
ncbi:MAG: hypothetical protein ABIW16_01310 [Sphingomicrobium sp.]